ncbi:MAG: Conserved uncharacterized protein CreA, partial [Olavius algarvensis Gamma 1 endosymbiont]
KIQNQVESRTVKTEMITNETTYSITSKISTTIEGSPKNSISVVPVQPWPGAGTTGTEMSTLAP